jgi:hypothetical protein
MNNTKHYYFPFLLIMLAAQLMRGQDTVQGPFKPDRPHELGLSIHMPILMIMGISNEVPRYSNLTYRYRLNDRRAIRAFIGARPPQDRYPDPVSAGIIPAQDTTYYNVIYSTEPSNFQTGVGFEWMFGRRLKHVPSVDIVYNNVFHKDEYFTMQTLRHGNTAVSSKLDSTAYVRAYNEDRYGFNFSYSLRYPLSRRWVITGSLVISYRYTSRLTHTGGVITNHSFDLHGPLSDISIFYRF